MFFLMQNIFIVPAMQNLYNQSHNQQARME